MYEAFKKSTAQFLLNNSINNATDCDTGVNVSTRRIQRVSGLYAHRCIFGMLARSNGIMSRKKKGELAAELEYNTHKQKSQGKTAFPGHGVSHNTRSIIDA
jgi:hypothetical protein